MQILTIYPTMYITEESIATITLTRSDKADLDAGLSIGLEDDQTFMHNGNRIVEIQAFSHNDDNTCEIMIFNTRGKYVTTVLASVKES